jgi:hypothetical protein
MMLLKSIAAILLTTDKTVSGAVNFDTYGPSAEELVEGKKINVDTMSI